MENQSRISPIRLGFPVRVVGRPGLNYANSAGHLSRSLASFADILGYLEQIDVHFYRIAASILPDDAFAQLDECDVQLDQLAARLAASAIRISTHLDHGLSLATPNDMLAARSLARIEAVAALLARLDAARTPGSIEGTMVLHVSAPASEPGSLSSFARRYAALSAQARARLAIEHDGAGFSLGQLLQLHQLCGVAIVFDMFHWEQLNPEGLPLDLALGLSLATWPPSVRPEVHLSSPRSEAHLLPAQAGKPAGIIAPRPGQHADFIDPAALQRLLKATDGLPSFDIMLEAKAGDLALLRLRSEIQQRAPGFAALLA